MSCLACDALTSFSRKGHTCQGGEALSRRFFLAAAALPQLLAASPVQLLGASDLLDQVLEKICRQAYQLADMMLKAEGETQPPAGWSDVAGELLEALKLARPVVNQHDVSEIASSAVQAAILRAEAAKVGPDPVRRLAGNMLDYLLSARGLVVDPRSPSERLAFLDLLIEQAEAAGVR